MNSELWIISNKPYALLVKQDAIVDDNLKLALYRGYPLPLTIEVFFPVNQIEQVIDGQKVKISGTINLQGQTESLNCENRISNDRPPSA